MLLLILVRIAMIVTVIALVYRFSRADRGEAPDGGRPRVILLYLVLLAIVLHVEFTPLPRPRLLVHHHDIFHYYMGAKYSREIGYFDLYHAAAVADEEIREARPQERRFSVYPIRRMDDYTTVSSRDVLRDAARYRSLFTDERWKQFRSDVAFFRDRLAEGSRWPKIFRDNGYNATPVWNMLARAITNRLPPEGPLGIPLLVLLDPLLLVAAFVAIGRSFDRRTALLGIVFVGTLFVMAEGTIRGAFLRLDWLALTVMATCALKVGRYRTAGALLAWAGALRIFPLALAFGVGARFLWKLVETRKPDRRYVGFFIAFALVVATLAGMSLIVDGGTDGWQSFADKIRFHDARMTHLRVGFKPLLLAGVAPFMRDAPETPTEVIARFSEIAPLWWIVQSLALVGVFFAARRLRDYEALALGYVLVYFLTAPTFYYQVVLLVPALWFLPWLREPARAHGAALLFGLSIVPYGLWVLQNVERVRANWLSLEWQRIDAPVTLALAGMLLVFSLYLLAFALHRSRHENGDRR